jgi:hypothetical protein
MAVDQLRQPTNSRVGSSITTNSIHKAIGMKDIPLKPQICLRKKWRDRTSNTEKINKFRHLQKELRRHYTQVLFLLDDFSLKM